MSPIPAAGKTGCPAAGRRGSVLSECRGPGHNVDLGSTPNGVNVLACGAARSREAHPAHCDADTRAFKCGQVGAQEFARFADDEVVAEVQAPIDAAREHFVANVVASVRDLHASEDILSANGMKLVAKGARVDAAMQERLVSHKLAKPLEQCLETTDAVDSAALAEVARRLFDEQPVLRSLHGERRSEVLRSIELLPLTSQLRSLLTLSTELPRGQLEHPVAVALLAMGLAASLGPECDCSSGVLLVAGLFHDVGELYIDPQLLTDVKLEPIQWRHIVAHPVIGHRVLIGLEGAGPMVADAVLQHHERHDGFGYPRRLAGSDLSSLGEVLAAAEWLAGLMRSGRPPFAAATAATRLMPGGFRDSLARVIWSVTAGSAHDDKTNLAAQHKSLAQLIHLVDTMRRFRDALPWLDQVIDAGTEASAVLAANHTRMEMIERSFVSCGLSGEDPLALFERLNAFDDPALIEELQAIVHEIGWRLRELERDTLLRASSLPGDEQRLVQQFVARLKARDTE